MEIEKLERTHIKLQFLMLLLGLIAFLVLAASVGNIVWFSDFRDFVVLISGIFGLFIGIIALLRYYTKKECLTYLFLGIGFLGVGILDLAQIVLESNGFVNLFQSSETYSFTTILSKGFLSFLIFVSWFVGRNQTKSGIDRNLVKKEKVIMFLVSSVFVLFAGFLISLSLSDFIEESVLVVVAGVFSLLLLILSLLGYIFRKNWEYSNLDYWIIFSIAFLILSQIFYLPFLNLEYFNMVNLSAWSQFIAYFALLVGFLNSIYEMFQWEKGMLKELEEKNSIIGEAKKKIEEAYLVTRKEKWDLVGKKKK